MASGLATDAVGAAPTQTSTTPSSSSASRFAWMISAFSILQVVVIEGKPTLQGSVGHSAFALEEVDDLGQDFIERHVQSSTTRLPRSL